MKIIKEDIENLETTETTTVVDQPMGAAKEESKNLWQRFLDATKEPEDAPLFGAKDQPVPEEVKEPKMTLDESLFNESWNDVEGKLYELFAENDFDVEHSDVQNYIRAAAEYIETAREADPDYSVMDWWQDTMENYPEDLESLPTAVNESVRIKESAPENIKAFFDGFIDGKDIDDLFSQKESLGEKLDDEDWIQEVDDEEEYFQEIEDDSMSEAYIGNWEIGVKYDDPTKQELAQFIGDKIYDALDNIFIEAQSKVDNLPEPEEYESPYTEKRINSLIRALVSEYYGPSSVDESLNESTSDIDDSLWIIKRYYKGRKSDDIIDSIFKMFPDNKEVSDLAAMVAERIEDFEDDSLEEDVDTVKVEVEVEQPEEEHEPEMEKEEEICDDCYEEDDSISEEELNAILDSIEHPKEENEQ